MNRRPSDGGLRRLWRKHLPMVDWSSIETPLTGGGKPDMNYCDGGAEGWIENKWTKGWEVTLRPEQIGWLCKRARHGGRVIVAVRRQCPAGPRTEAADELWLCAGSAARELKLYGLPRAVGAPRTARWPAGALLGAWHGGPGRWDWAAARAVLVG